jgi:hypothetical protein
MAQMRQLSANADWTGERAIEMSICTLQTGYGQAKWKQNGIEVYHMTFDIAH